MQRIDRRRSFVPLVYRRVVLGRRTVEEITGLQRHLVLPAGLSPTVGVVDAERVDRRHTALRPHHQRPHAAAAARTSRHAQNVLERKILLVDVVEQPDHRHAARPMEQIDVAAHVVLVVRRCSFCFGLVAVTGIELAELALTHVGFRDDIDRLVPLAVVHTRKFGRIAQLVVDLDLVDRLCGQRLDRRSYVLAEELLAVDEDLLHGLALCLDLAVGNGDAGHLLEQPFDIGVGRHLEGSGIVAHRIALLRRTHRLHLLDHGLDLGRRRRQLERAERLFGGRQFQLLFKRFVAQKRNGNLVGTVGNRRLDAPLVPRREVTFLRRRIRRRKLHDGTRHALARRGVDHGRRHAARLGINFHRGEQCHKQ